MIVLNLPNLPQLPNLPIPGLSRGGEASTGPSFLKQSERVLNVTHKPGPFEYRQIAYITGIGMLLMGAIGFLLSMAFHLSRGTL